jgi:quercetin dioxygenase-like cupin family protein
MILSRLEATREVTLSSPAPTDGIPAESSYRPSPRPAFSEPTQISSRSAVRHIWGDPGSGEVTDQIYVSSGFIHALVFGLEPQGSFRHSPDHRTVFGADELLYVLDGIMVIANPETGEVQRLEAGESVFFRRDTWHHAFAHGASPLHVLELFAPPPATGASGAYARTRPYLDGSRYADDSLLGRLAPASVQPGTLRRLDQRDIVWRRDLGVLVGLLASTEHLTAGVTEVDPGQKSTVHAHGGDQVLYVTSGQLTVRAWQEDVISVFALEPSDVCYLPHGCAHEYRNYSATTARAIFGVAPSYVP